MTPTSTSLTAGALPRGGGKTRNAFWLLTLSSIGVVYGDIGTRP